MARNLATGLAERHRVTVITSAWNGAVGVSHEAGVDVHRLRAVHWSEGWGVPYPTPVGVGLRRALAAIGDADVVHAHGALYASTVIATTASRYLNRPLVLTEHVGFVQYPRPILNAAQHVAWRSIGNWVVARTDAIAVYNRRVQQWLGARYPGGRIWYIGNGVDQTAFQPRLKAEIAGLRRSFSLPEDKTLVLFAGREAAKKNLDVVLRIPRRDFALVVCGAERSLVGDGIIDLGILPYARMPDLFACVDAMVLPSTGEGFPLAVQEAVASGLPLVLLWDDGYSGWLERDVVAACESVDELAGAVQYLVGDAGARSRISAAERQWAVRMWSWGKTVNAYEDLYAQVLERGAVNESPIRSDFAVG